MTEKEIIQKVEKCLQSYPANLSRMEVLRKDLHVLKVQGDVKGQNYENVRAAQSQTGHSDPVFNFVKRVEELEREIERIARITEPLTKMIQDLKTPYALDQSLNSDFIKILGLYYFGRNPVVNILEETGWSRAGFFRKKKQLQDLARSYLGY